MIGDDGLAEIEKFDESTYNKRLERLKPYIGDENIKSESAILAVKQSTATIRESKDFLERLYGAEDGKTWWRNDPQS